MSRLLIGSEWYDGLASTALYEIEFERLVLEHAGRLFPSFLAVPFKADVESENGRHRADVALIDRQYRWWWVVEVELAHHSLHGHVLPQVEGLARGTYDGRHAAALAAADDRLSPTALSEMMLGAQPRVLVVVNLSMPEWAEAFRRFDALVTVVEVFRSSRNKYCLRLNGEQPRLEPDLVSLCTRDAVLPRSIRIKSPAALGIENGQRIDVFYDGRTSEWERFESASAVWLRPTGVSPLPPDVQSVQLVREQDGSLSFRLLPERNRR